MEIIAQRGLPVNAQTASGQRLRWRAMKSQRSRLRLTSGFARTGYELETIEAREQKLNYGKAAGETRQSLLR